MENLGKMNAQLLFAVVRAHNSGINIDKFDIKKLIKQGGLENSILFFESLSEKERKRGMPKLKVKRKLIEPVNTLGEMIEEEYIRCEGLFSLDEEFEAHTYFSYDFDRCLDFMYECIEDAKAKFPNGKKYVTKSEKMIARAKSDMEAIPIIDPNGRVYESEDKGNFDSSSISESEKMGSQLSAAKSQLRGISRKYAIYFEDPRRYWRYEINQAVKVEDFFRAISLRAKIEEFSREKGQHSLPNIFSKD